MAHASRTFYSVAQAGQDSLPLEGGRHSQPAPQHPFHKLPHMLATQGWHFLYILPILAVF
jgi:hypothetical protein